MSAPVRAHRRPASAPFTVACVPTGMKAGVRTTPCGVAISPRRAAPSVAIRRKEKGSDMATSIASSDRLLSRDRSNVVGLRQHRSRCIRKRFGGHPADPGLLTWEARHVADLEADSLLHRCQSRSFHIGHGAKPVRSSATIRFWTKVIFTAIDHRSTARHDHLSSPASAAARENVRPAHLRRIRHLGERL